MQSPFFEYQAHARAYLARAKELLRRFDEGGDPGHFFYAALELRTGIEARAWDYLRVALQRHGKKPEDLSDFAASKLLRRLLEHDPEADQHVVLKATSNQSGSTTVLAYTPMPKRLGAIHGMLGELLHYKFFINNEFWNFKKPIEGTKGKSIANFRELLGDAVEGLERATSTTLLAPPKFEWLDDEIEHADDRDG